MFPIGSVAALDWQSTPKTWGNLGVDHVSTFMGVAGDGYGWFLGGNQSGRLQPKLYQLEDATFISKFNDTGSSDIQYFAKIGEMSEIKLEGELATHICSRMGIWSKQPTKS